MAAEVIEAGFDAGPNLLRRPAAGSPAGILARLLGRGQNFGRQLLGHVVDVVAVVAVLGDLAAFANGHDRCAEILHLAAEIVEVVLALDLMAGGRQDAAQEIAGEGAPSIADVERPGRVGRHELDVDVLRMLGGDAAPGRRVAQNLLRRSRQSVVGEADVEEPWRRHFHRDDGGVGVRGRGGHMGGDRRGDLERRAAVWLGQPQGDVAGKVAPGRVRGALDRDRRVVWLCGFGQIGLSARPGGFNGLADLRSQAGRGVGGHVRMVASPTQFRGTSGGWWRPAAATGVPSFPASFRCPGSYELPNFARDTAKGARVARPNLRCRRSSARLRIHARGPREERPARADASSCRSHVATAFLTTARGEDGRRSRPREDRDAAAAAAAALFGEEPQPTYAGHTQSRISGASSPSARV